MGLIINRATDFTMRELFSQLELECTDEQLNDQPVLWGGPVQTDRGFVLHRDLRDWPSTLRFGSGLAVTTSKEVLVSLAQGDGPKNPLIMLGYAGWEVGQLEQELVENSWLNAPVNDALLFETPYELRWQAAARQLGIDIQNMTDYSGHA